MRITLCATAQDFIGGGRVPRRMSLAEAAAQGDELAQSGAERELATLRQQWDDELESAARSSDYRARAIAYRAIGQFRFRQKLELLRRGLEDESPAARGSALLSVQLLSKDSPGVVNGIRPLLHSIVTTDANQAVRRLAVLCLRHGSPQRETIVLLNGLAEDDEQEPELRNAARTVAADLKKKAGPKG
jgi:HEAT repeat protein